MQPPPDPHQRGVSTREAAAILGTSPSDVLRRIRAGELRAERFERRGGTYFRVFLESPQDAPADAVHPEDTPPPESRQDTSDLAVRLLDKLDERDAMIAGLHAELLTLAERAARAEALAEQRQETLERIEAQRAELAAEVARLRRRRGRIVPDVRPGRESAVAQSGRAAVMQAACRRFESVRRRIARLFTLRLARSWQLCCSQRHCTEAPVT